MCGIVGISSGNPIDSGALDAAVAAIAHRGPDSNGTYISDDRCTAFGHTRLSIIDLSPLGHQPMIDTSSGVSLTYNGEIYNYRDLRDELEKAGHTFKGHSDTEVLLAGYLEWGEDVLGRLNGIFAFGIHDPREDLLFVARDALGVKPIYYNDAGTDFVFSSEIKAMLPFIADAGAIDHLTLSRYISYLWSPGETTPLSSIRKIKPGHAAIVKRGKLQRVWRWYELPPFRGVRSTLNEADSIALTESHLREAVHRQMVADVPVGAFLSGGLDSSAVVAFAREKNPDISCFTIESDGEEAGVAEDLPYAQKVADHLGVKLEIVKIEANDLADTLEAMVWQLDEPIADTAPMNVLYISQLAKKQGIKVLLSGSGGDDLFTGYRRHMAVNMEGYWNWLPSSVRGGLERATGKLNQGNTQLRRIAKAFRGAGLSGDERLASYFLWLEQTQVASLFSEPFRDFIREQNVTDPLTDFLEPLPDEVGAIDRMLLLEQNFFLPDHNLTYTDKMSMATGVEVRVPFLDLELIDHAARIPSKYKQKGKEGKWVLKKAMEPHLPHDVIYRPKTGFGAPLRRWIKGDLKPFIQDILSPSSLKQRGIFEPVAVQDLIDRNERGAVDGNYAILSLLCIELWCRKFVDRSEAELQKITA